MTRPCSTPGCQRQPRPHYAMCSACIDRLLAAHSSEPVVMGPLARSVVKGLRRP